MDPSDLKAFFGGLSHNRSIQGLKIFIQSVYEQVDEIMTFERVFEALLPFFQFNNNLQVFDFNMLKVLPIPSKASSMMFEAILAAKSLKSIRLKSNIE